METYFLGTDGKPCIWPVPSDCVWTLDRYKLKKCLRIFAADEFKSETLFFAESLKESYQVIQEHEIAIADIRVLKCYDNKLGTEGYSLKAGESGVEIRALSDTGAFYGLQTLYQLITNSPDPSIHGVRIEDKPLTAFRGVCTNIPGPDETERFKRFVDLIARYKFNKLAFKTRLSPKKLREGIEDTEISNMAAY
jgi:hexosaminidase